MLKKTVKCSYSVGSNLVESKTTTYKFLGITIYSITFNQI